MRVTERSEGLGLALESVLPFWISRDVLGEDLDGNGAVQACISGPVDLPIPPDPIGAAMTYGPSRVPGAIIDGRPLTYPLLGESRNPSCRGKPA
jgi:hypothetical protein